MNIKNRIKQIETKTGVHSNFCLCYSRFPKLELVLLKIDDFNRRFSTGEETEIKLPDFCEKCRKPIDKSKIDTTFEQFQSTVKSRLNNAVSTYRKHSE